MDLSARRGLWEMLKNSRKDKIIILTTHYMDEADVLGDRIGIMAAGKIICLGSSLFLKNRYGTGFKLTLVKATKEPNEKIGLYIKERLGECEFLSEVASEITFKIPSDLLDKFQNFFNDFDGDLEELGILSYGINMTSLEEVFLKSNEPAKSPEIQAAIEAKEDDEDGKSPSNTPNDQPDTIDRAKEAEETENLVGSGTLCSNIGALIIKRLHLYRRDVTGLICEVVLPIILVAVGLSFVYGVDTFSISDAR